MNFKKMMVVAVTAIVFLGVVGVAFTFYHYMRLVNEAHQTVEKVVAPVVEQVAPTVATIKDNYLARCEKEPELVRCIAVKKEK